MPWADTVLFVYELRQMEQNSRTKPPFLSKCEGLAWEAATLVELHVSTTQLALESLGRLEADDSFQNTDIQVPLHLLFSHRLL